MKVKNVKVTRAKVKCDDREILKANIFIEGMGIQLELNLGFEKEEDMQKIKKIMEYAEVDVFEDLEGKILRIMEKDGKVEGIGHAINSRFIPLSNGKRLMEVTEEAFKAICEPEQFE